VSGAPPEPDSRLHRLRRAWEGGDRAQAVAEADALIGAGPAACESLFALAQEALRASDLDLADLCVGRLALALPGHPDLIHATGLIRHQQGRLWEAIRIFQAQIDADPRNARAADGLARALQAQGRLDEAERWWKTSLALGLDTYDVRFGLASVLRARHRFDEAAGEYVAAARHVPPGSGTDTFVRLMQAFCLLAIGDWAAGWRAYEQRLTHATLAHLAALDRIGPRWRGEVVAGATLLVVWEQGFGDNIQFVRYLRAFDGTGMRVVLVCLPELRRLFALALGGAVEVVSADAVPPFTFYVPLLSLPLALMPRLGTAIPAQVPYLAAEPGQVAARRRQVEAIAPGRPRLGLAWAGNPAHANDWARSIDARLIAAMLDLDADFFVVQPGLSLAPFVEAGYRNIHDLTDGVGDFLDTAAALEALDGLISVDTSVVHLAGALGRPVWMPLPFLPDWRWGLWGTRTPWYPTVRLFRQPADGDWAAALLALGADLVRWLADERRGRGL